ncbi:MAG: glutamine--tRNA ligase [Chthoniobacterales bacterium]|nr:glutamine--tRNA ligase [Chthoniobacterales bacterium]
MTEAAEKETAPPTDFIREIVMQDVQAGKHGSVHTRFPPEPNGYLHIGHAKAICLGVGLAREFGGLCNVRMDDTNPAKEESEYVDSILADVRWLLTGWGEPNIGLKPVGKTPEIVTVDGRRDFQLRPLPYGEDAAGLAPFYASDYFEQIYVYAEQLVRAGKAYVCDMTAEETDQYRRIGKESPFRSRSTSENEDLLTRMRAGEFPEGARTLRAKIDMSSPNMWLRDPVLYRIRHVEHHHTGDAWCIYPMYDFAHCLSDYIEGITHSLCTLEFEVHRPLYDWILQSLELPRSLPRQIEFARLNIDYTVISKRKLLQLVNDGSVQGWDDPRMPTLSGLRRRGITATAIRSFITEIGVTKYPSLTEFALLEHAVRQEFNRSAQRRFAVLRPIKVVVTNYPEGRVEELSAINNPENPEAGTRQLPFSRELFIESADFMEVPPPKYFRLKPGGEVRLKYAYIIKCDKAVKNEAGEITELRCTADLDSKSGGPTSNRKVKGTIHWVSAAQAVGAEVRLYDRLFTVPEPDADGDFKAHLNPASLEIVKAKCEPSLANAKAEERYQFERLAYFALDPDSAPGKPVFNRTITLKDTWAKEAKKS